VLCPLLALGCAGIPDRDYYLRVGGAARPEYAPPLGVPLAEKAARFEALAARFISPIGQLVYTQPVSAAGFVWRRQADQAIWSGAYLAAESLRYAVTRDPAVLERVRRLARGVHALTEVTGVRGLYARSLWPTGAVAVPAGAAVHPGAGRFRGYTWRGDVSKDQLSGIVCGLSMAWLLVDDAEIREIARRDSAALVDHLLAHDMRIVDVDGEPTTFGDLAGRIWGIPIGVNALIALTAFKLAALSNPERPHYGDAYAALISAQYPDYAYWSKFQLFGKTNHNNDNMQYLATLPLLYLEGEPETRAKVVAALERTFFYVKHEGNAWFNYVSMCGFGYDRAAAADARLTMQLFPLDKRPLPVDLRGDPRFEESCFRARGGRPKAIGALPINYREMTVFAWRDDPYALVSGEGAKGDELAAPVDYLLAYWLGRYAGFIGPAE
jgi:hypothetical protein